MNTKSSILLLATTIIVFASLYAPQPLLPVLSKYFSVSEPETALLITITLIPLAIAPIVYGFLLESITSKKILRTAIFLLMVSEFLIFINNNFTTFLLLRLLQGFLASGILTSIMTYISKTSEKINVQRYMGLYIGSTIFGGFLSRFISGSIETLFGWRFSFLGLFFSLMIIFIGISFIKSDTKSSLTKIKLNSFVDILKNKIYFKTYIAIFCDFFIFASLLNILPFRLTEINKNISGFGIGIMYSGYIAGSIISINVVKIIKLLGSELKAMMLGFLIYCASLVLFNIKSITSIFFTMFVFCSGMFITHSVASGFLNKIADKKKGVVNGLYVAFYYSGGAIGTFLPVFIYKSMGWFIYTLSLMAVATIGFLSILSIYTRQGAY